MADFMKLADSTVIEIQEGASLGNIVYIPETEADGLAISKKFTSENLTHVEFYSSLENAAAVANAEPSGEYDDLVANSVYFDVENMQVLISLREKTDIELRLEAIEEEQEIQNEAIDFLAMEM